MHALFLLLSSLCRQCVEWEYMQRPTTGMLLDPLQTRFYCEFDAKVVEYTAKILEIIKKEEEKRAGLPTCIR